MDLLSIESLKSLKLLGNFVELVLLPFSRLLGLQKLFFQQDKNADPASRNYSVTYINRVYCGSITSSGKCLARALLKDREVLSGICRRDVCTLQLSFRGTPRREKRNIFEGNYGINATMTWRIIDYFLNFNG